MEHYRSPRWTNEIADCSMPMTFDTYSNCSFGCIYCFSQFQRGNGGGKDNYFAKKEVKQVDPERIKRMFTEPDKYGGQFAEYIKQRKVMQWGGLSDQFDGFERTRGVTLELLKFFKSIDYPLCFSTEANYLTIITTCRGLQIQRNFEVICNGRKGEGVNYLFHEVVQLWLDESGAESFFACNRAPFSMYLDRWTWGTLSCKHRQSYYYGNPWLFMGVVYPHWRALPILKRNGYIVEDAPSWVDYIDELRELGLDTHSPKYVCPADLQAAHRRTSRRVERKREAERHEENRKKAASYESAYWEEKNKFFGMVISDGAITIRPLLSVMEFADEAAAMHHCVFSGEYFKRKTSLILTARNAADKRLETIEFDLRSFRVLQSRGVNNSNTENHDHILSLVNSNINTIKKYAHDKT